MKRDLAVVAAVAALVPLVWLLLGWRGELLGAHDSTLYFLLLEHRGAAYQPAVLGGVATAGVYGAPPFLPIGSVAAFNVAVLETQVLHGVLGAFAALDLARLLGGSPRPRSHAIPLALALAFAPVLGWRLSYGHLNLVWATFLVTAPLALIVSARVRPSRLTQALALLALVHTFRSHGFQVMLYTAVFGGPLLVAVALHRAPRRDALRALSASALVIALALLLSLPALSAMLRYSLGPDATRRAGDASGFAYLTGTSRDVLASLTWTPWASVRAPQLLHDTHYPLGAPLLLLAWFPLRRAPLVAAALLFAFVGAVLFATDVRPVSSLFLLFPPMGAFRVPLRALLVFATALPIVAVASLYARRMRFDLRIVTALLAVGSVLSFREKLLPFPTRAALVDEPRELGAVVRAHASDLATPLDRVSLQLSSPLYGPNTAWAAGLSSIDGYGYPARRFVALAAAVSGVPYDPRHTILVFDPRTRAFAIMGQLYNVRALVGPGGVVTRPGATAGAAWFSARTERVASFAELARVLHANAPKLSSAAHDVAWLVGDDGPTNAFACEGAVESVTGEGRVSVSVTTRTECVLTLATNYLATASVRIDGRAARTFPTYGALLGVLVPASAREIVLESSR